jgi:hypothetical protein
VASCPGEATIAQKRLLIMVLLLSEPASQSNRRMTRGNSIPNYRRILAVSYLGCLDLMARAASSQEAASLVTVV